MPKIRKSQRKNPDFAKNEVLAGFTQMYPSVYQPTTETKIHKQLAAAQAFWDKSELSADKKSVSHFSVLFEDSIYADTGANAFMPPESFDSVKFSIENFSGYTHFKPSDELTSNVLKTYKGFKYLPPATKLDNNTHLENSDPNALYMTYGEGTTIIFHACLKHLVKNKKDVFIVPVPTYGLFATYILEHCKIAPLELTHENDFKIDPTALGQLIIDHEHRLANEYTDDLRFKIELTEQQNISQALKTEIQDGIEKILSVHSDFQAIHVDTFNKHLKKLQKDLKISKHLKSALLLEQPARVRGIYFINPMIPVGTVHNQSEINELAEILKDFPEINVIEDNTHRGINLYPDLEEGNFTHTCVSKKTLTMDGISKIFDLAKARAGIVIGAKEHIQPIASTLQKYIVTMGCASEAFLEKSFSLKNSERQQHLKEMGVGYKKRLEIVRALVYGLASVENKLQAEVKETIESVFKNFKSKVKHEKAKQQAVLNSVFDGIPGLKFYSEPKAAYFVLIDFSHFINQYLGGICLKSAMDIRNALTILCDVDSIPDVMCYQSGKGFLRISLSVNEEEELVEAFLRIKRLMSYCSPEPMLMDTPERQPCAGEKRALNQESEYQTAKKRKKVKKPPQDLDLGPVIPESSKTKQKIEVIELDSSDDEKKTEVPAEHKTLTFQYDSSNPLPWAVKNVDIPPPNVTVFPPAYNRFLPRNL